MNLKVVFSISFMFTLITARVFAQNPVVKVDLNIGSRTEAEVTEPGYIPWPINGGADSMEIEGVTIAFKNGSIQSSWYKAGVQTPNFARLANDGIKTTDVEMHLSNLPAGHHTLVSFHNTFDNPETNVFAHLNIYVNDVLKVSDLEMSNRTLSNEAATTAFVEFDVQDNETVVIRFESAPQPSTTNQEITICGFILNGSDPKTLASYPYPSDLDNHVNIADDQLTLSWTPPSGTVSQDIYFGTDFNAVQAADNTSAAFAGNQADTFLVKSNFYALDSYYWRVDPINGDGEKSKGDVWSFKVGRPAFIGAEGYGGTAVGGRGGKVVYVTNLNDDGPGSFRAAVTENSGPRTVIFNVSGIIHLESRLNVDDYVTIAGQTAPGKGICFRAAPIGIGNESICRFIRMRLGAGTTYDGIGMAGAQYSIVDHCSISWTIDESFSSRGAKNITLQRTLVSEALNVAGHDKYGVGKAHGFAATIGGNVGSFHHNLLAHNEGRNWSLGGGLDGNGYYAGLLDIFNNVVYNWGGRATDGGAHEVNFVNNYYKKGASTDQDYILNAQLEGVGKGSQSYYFSGNILEGTDGSLECDGTDNTCSRTVSIASTQEVDWEVFVDEPFFPSYAEIHDADDAYKNVLSDVGCTMPVFDDHDQRIITETLNGTTTYRGSKTGKAGLIDHQDDAGGYESYPMTARPEDFDADLDGLPDWWENLHGMDASSPEGDYSDSNTDSDRDGFTNLEDYLQWMSVPHYYLDRNESQAIDLSLLTMGYENGPGFSTATANGNLDISYDNEILNVTAKAEAANGIHYFEFKVTDNEGSSMTRKIGICVGAIEPAAVDLDPTPDDGDTTLLIVDRLNSMALYPNPASDRVTIKNMKDVQNIRIVNLAGESVMELKPELNQDSLTIDVSVLESSIYILYISGKSGTHSIKFLKE